MQLAELKPGLAIVGLEPDLVCSVVAVNAIAAGAVQVYYKLPDGAIKERLLGTADEVIALLGSDPNATLRITLEIDAEFPNGASDTIRRGVSENATSLGFKAKDWE